MDTKFYLRRPQVRYACWVSQRSHHKRFFSAKLTRNPPFPHRYGIKKIPREKRIIQEVIATAGGSGHVQTIFDEMQSDVKNCNEVDKDYTKQIIPDVVTLNVGGCIFTTSLSTLQKSSQSMLAAMFSGRHSLVTDSCGRFFIDRNGFLFEHILNFLRQEQLPPLDLSLKVYEEAEFFNLMEMCDALEVLKPVATKKLREKFLDQVPSYHEKVVCLLTEARKNVFLQPDRISKLRVSIFKEEQHSTSHDVNTTSQLNGQRFEARDQHCCDVNVMFGPWKGNLGVYDLLDCIKYDLRLKGYDLECQCIGVCDRHIWGQHFCKRPIFEFKFRWW